MAYYHHNHAEKHQNSHQAYSQADGCQAQLVTGLQTCVGAWGVGLRHITGLALGTAEMGGADADGLAFGSDGAGPSVEAGLRGTVVCRPVAVAACVPWRAGAGIVIDAVYAGGAVCTGVAGALIDVDLTAQSGEAWATAAQSEVTVDHAMATYAKQNSITEASLVLFLTQIYRKGKELLLT